MSIKIKPYGHGFVIFGNGEPLSEVFPTKEKAKDFLRKFRKIYKELSYKYPIDL